MKKILFLFVVMLGTLGAYAQSNTTPIKGDVNEDGVVDICYVYVLTNADKDVVISDPADPFIPLTKAEDTSTINGYKIV